MLASEIIKRPIITEKTMILVEQFNKYTFSVDKRANKIQIARAIEELFNVKVVKVNKKVKRLALRSVLSLKVKDDSFKVLDSLTLESIQTKGMVEVLNNLNVSGKIMIVLPENNDSVALSARNIPGVTVTTVSHASVYEIMNYRTVVTTVDAVKLYEEVLG